MEVISVVVPLYNQKKYLSRCIDSLLKQTYSPLEIIIVDDGSNDGGEIECDKYASLSSVDKTIIIIHQKNAGLSSARNVGISHTSGKYIGFVDADDYISEDMYLTLYNLLTNNDADIACCGTETFNNNGHLSYFNNDFKMLLVLNKKQALKYHALSETKFISCSVWDKLYKREIVVSKDFVPGALFEDMINTPYYLASANKVVVTGQPLYHYFINDNGLSNAAFSPKHYQWFNAFKLKRQLYENEASDLLNILDGLYIDVALTLLYRSRKDIDNKSFRDSIIKEIKIMAKKDDVILNKKTRFKLKLFNISQPLFYFVMDIKHGFKK